MSLLGLLGAFMGARQNIKGANYAPQQATTAQMQNVSDAYMNPDNPTYQLLYGKQKANNLANLSSAITELERRNRFSSGMGRTPLFADGREGEMAFRTMAQGYQDADLTAQNQARDILRGGYGMLQNNMGAQNQMTDFNLKNRRSKMMGYQNILDALQQMGIG